MGIRSFTNCFFFFFQKINSFFFFFFFFFFVSWSIDRQLWLDCQRNPWLKKQVRNYQSQNKNSYLKSVGEPGWGKGYLCFHQFPLTFLSITNTSNTPWYQQQQLGLCHQQKSDIFISHYGAADISNVMYTSHYFKMTMLVDPQLGVIIQCVNNRVPTVAQQ